MVNHDTLQRIVKDQKVGCPPKIKAFVNFFALAQLPFAGLLYVWKLIFWSFLTKTKPDIALNYGYDFVLLVHFLGHPVESQF